VLDQLDEFARADTDQVLPDIKAAKRRYRPDDFPAPVRERRRGSPP
jgi:hypothetical protein